MQIIILCHQHLHNNIFLINRDVYAAINFTIAELWHATFYGVQPPINQQLNIA